MIAWFEQSQSLVLVFAMPLDSQQRSPAGRRLGSRAPEGRAAEAATQLDAGVKASACSRLQSSHQRQRIKHVCPLHDSARRLLGRSTINTHTTCVSLRCAPEHTNSAPSSLCVVRVCGSTPARKCSVLPNSTHFGVSSASSTRVVST